MNEEIKEILDLLNFNKDTISNGTCQLEDFMSREQIIKLLNYITNLQQENETLKAKLEIGKTCGFCPYYDYKSRCKKAIELYKNCKEEDYCILSLNMYEVLNGSDEK